MTTATACPAEQALVLLQNLRASAGLALDPRVGPVRAAMAKRAGTLLHEAGASDWGTYAYDLGIQLEDNLVSAETDMDAAFEHNTTLANMLIRLVALVEMA